MRHDYFCAHIQCNLNNNFFLPPIAVCVTSSTWYESKLPPGTVVCQQSVPCRATTRLFYSQPCSSWTPFLRSMASNLPDSHPDDALLVTDEELEQALCVLAGSDPENCSYSRVKHTGPAVPILHIFGSTIAICVLLKTCFSAC